MRRAPGKTEALRARSVLVLAPHYDDEVLGCGGLLLKLLADGATVRVLFLTDGGGGEEEIGDREAYRRRRQEEGEAVAEHLGLTAEHLGLADGSLDSSREALGEVCRRALADHLPDLLLVPSPLESSADHRAAFAALHDVLGAVREGSELHSQVRSLKVLAYEVNHSLYPDVLVDVSDELEGMEGAMALYASQEERHGYLAAALGLRRFRTLSLPTGVAAAEGYARLSLADFTTRSPAQLIRHLGGASEIAEVYEGPKISVVVRTRDRPELLAEALESLAEGSYRRAEVVLVNDGGSPPEISGDFPFPIVRVDLPENLGRAGAANAGVAAATGDCVCFLDDDDLAAPEHLEVLAGLIGAAGVRVAYSDAAVGIYELSGDGWSCIDRRLPYSRDFDGDLLLLDNYIPFNTLIFERAVLEAAGPFDNELPFFEDWEMLIRLAQLTPFHHLGRVTCEYRHFRGGGHHVFGERPAQRADFEEVKARVLARHAAKMTPDRLAAAVGRLRREAVDSGEALGEAERKLESLDGELSRLNGRAAALEGDRHRLRQAYEEGAQEIQRLHAVERELRHTLAEHEEHLGKTYDEIRRLTGELEAATRALDEHRVTVTDQTEHLGRTYGEIERLNGILRDMEQTRAWRLHRWFQGRKS